MYLVLESEQLLLVVFAIFNYTSKRLIDVLLEGKIHLMDECIYSEPRELYLRTVIWCYRCQLVVNTDNHFIHVMQLRKVNKALNVHVQQVGNFFLRTMFRGMWWRNTAPEHPVCGRVRKSESYNSGFLPMS